MRIFLIILCLLVGISSTAFADDLYTNPDKFKEFNPDGQKFQFARDYISSLSYLYANQQRDQKIRETSLEVKNKADRLKILKDNLSSQNVNLRVARNLLKRYKVSDNGLILKVVDLFTKVCDGLIEMNEKEKTLLDEIDQPQGEGPSEAVASRFLREQKQLWLQRKETSKKLLKCSVLLTKLLVSQKEDRFGELVNLGITSSERKRLLEQIKSFSGEKFKGKLRQGQSFLEGSITSIRQVLEDPSWGTTEKNGSKISG